MKIYFTKKREKNRPICPECGQATIVLFTPPKEGLVGTEKGYKLYAERNWQEYVDWNRAHLYCCNGEKNCRYEAKLIGDEKLTT